ncbi:hypothetical protein NDU88_001506 [Pleurodeles waltl]|uniref:Uncharacterized protein n=1 Tax=Pleurodeles waltl TaxID=8319 RepID=A0AAV7VAI6_PLEWA|nr:hypothetical protein NDU88_001506 [Pleurodeles waltl]
MQFPLRLQPCCTCLIHPPANRVAPRLYNSDKRVSDTPASQLSSPEHHKQRKRDRHSALAPCREKAEERVARTALGRIWKRRTAPCFKKYTRLASQRVPRPSLVPHGSLPRPGRRARQEKDQKQPHLLHWFKCRVFDWRPCNTTRGLCAVKHTHEHAPLPGNGTLRLCSPGRGM